MLNIIKGGMALAGLLAAPLAWSYDFPLQNPFEATIAGTPASLQPQDLPADKHIDQTVYRLNLRPEREFSLPDNFWAVRQLSYTVARQHQEAPLIFLIAGTGSHYAAGTMEFLKRVFYREGYHVVQLSSPTSYDFMAAASRHATPGISREDARDLHDVMLAIRAAHPDLPVSHYHLLGYSLGGLNAAFVSALDDERGVFGFRRVLMINPPVNLYAATANLDRLVQARVPGIASSFSFFENVFNKLAVYFKDRGGVEISDAMLFDFQRSAQRLSDEELAMLIGTVFRFAAADVVFTSDLVSRRGQIVPVDERIRQGTPLTPYFQRALFCNFHCYIQHQLLPHWRRHFSGSSLDDLIHDTSLFALSSYLADNPRVGAFVNADDLIHSPGELHFLRRVLGDRLTVYPRGGHLGNISYHENVAAMTAFFRSADTAVEAAP